MKRSRRAALSALAIVAMLAAMPAQADFHGPTGVKALVADKAGVGGGLSLAVILAALSTMLNAAIVWNTQCRELTLEEALGSSFVPLGIGMDQHDNRCHRPHQRADKHHLLHHLWRPPHHWHHHRHGG